jgi:CubicO group peptidase (beta-lactamase class C family)
VIAGRAFLAATVLAACGRTPAPAPAGDPLATALVDGTYRRVTSVMAVQGERTLVERYANGASAETLHDPRSAMKSVTALAVGVAIADGALPSLDAPAFAYLQDLAPFAHDDPAKAAITIGDLITMSSPLDCNDDDPQSPGNEENMYPRPVWARWAVDLPVRAGWQRDAAGRGAFSYCTAGTFLLGQILQRVTKTPVDRWIEQRLLAPLGIERSSWKRSPSGEVMTGGGLGMRTRDLLRLGQLVLQGGQWNGAQVVPAAWIAAMTSAQRKPSADQDPRGELDYGYLIWRRDYRTPCGPASGWYMSGNGGNHVVVLDSLDAVAVVTTVNFNTRGMHDQTTRLLEERVWPLLACPAP